MTQPYIKLNTRAKEIQQVNPIESDNTSLQCYRVLSDILVKKELCIPLERGSNVLSTDADFIVYLLPVSLNLLCFSVLSTKDHFVQCYSVLGDSHPMVDDQCHVTK